MPIKRLNHAVLYVSDAKRSMRFYTEVLGFRVRSAIGESDHGVSKSLYGKDPDGIEFEVMWAVPRADWPDRVGTWPLDLGQALARWTGVDTADQA